MVESTGPAEIGAAEALSERAAADATLAHFGQRQVHASRSVWQRFARHRLALLGLAVLTVLVIAAVLAPVIAHNPYRVDLTAYRKPPSAQHWLGTDAAGRDVYSRLVYAGRVSMSVGLVAVGIYTFIGLVLGAIGGFFGGWADSLVMRLADVFLSFPSLIVIITMVSILGPSIYNVMLAIGLLGWPAISRLLRGELLSLREREFVTAARSIGAPSYRIILRHLLPNAMAPIIVAATLGIANAILLEAGLSFLGLGVQPPTASWGNMLTDAQSLPVLSTMPWLWLPPGLMIAIAVLSINFVGDGLRDALDPHIQR